MDASQNVPTASLPGNSPPVRIERIGLSRLDTIRRLNRMIFDDDHIINSFDHTDLLILLAVEHTGDARSEGGRAEGEAVGFKMGYRLSADVFYSAKGGVVPAFRRRGIARLLLHDLMARARDGGYTRFAYDTFPNKHPGMTVLGLDEGFRVTRAGYSARYEDYRLRFEKAL